jgi:hypothetical protein
MKLLILAPFAALMVGLFFLAAFLYDPVEFCRMRY